MKKVLFTIALALSIAAAGYGIAHISTDNALAKGVDDGGVSSL